MTNIDTTRQPNPSITGGAGGGSKMKNLIVRTLTGIVFIVVMIGGILYSPLTTALLFALITALSAWEFTGIINKQDDVELNRFITTVAAIMFFFGFFGYALGISPSLAFLPWLLSCTYLMITELYLQRQRPILNWALTAMSQLYIALPFGLLCLLRSSTDAELSQLLGNNGATVVLAIFVCLWCSDTGAYCTGSLIGRHKLFPRISPAKSWEGSIGGAFTALIASQIFHYYAPELTSIEWAIFAIVVVFFGTWGDLSESLLKRQIGIKDSGNILPGHGGMLDRFDSSLLAIPAVFIYLCTLAIL